MINVQSTWEETLRRDLSGFADRDSVVVHSLGASDIEAMWTERGEYKSAEFRLSSNGDFRWLDESNRERNYREYLCSRDLGRFEQLADSITRTIDVYPNYITTKATLDNDNDDNKIYTADDLLEQLSTNSVEDWGGTTTSLFFVKAGAGAGKTTLLRELTRRKAEEYRNGKCNFLYLYISAQGRALTNLTDAISGELGSLRSNFSSDAVPALVREGALVLIIDGFDELLGAAGYGDAFGSLHSFLSKLDARGALVVSARSSFYDSEFVGRTSTTEAVESGYEIEPITLLPWGAEEIYRYIDQAGGPGGVSTKARRSIERLSDPDRELLATPFFARLFLDLVAEAGVEESLRGFLFAEFVRREARKFVDSDGTPLLSPSGHELIFEKVAEDMWINSGEYIAEYLPIEVEYVADSFNLSSDAAQQIATKITSYAGLRQINEGRLEFEHRVFFEHFLAQAIRRFLEEELVDIPTIGDAAIRFSQRFLDHALLSEEIVGAVVDSDNCDRWLDLLSHTTDNTSRRDNRQRNAGSLVAAAFRSAQRVVGRVIRYCRFVNTSFDSVSFLNTDFVNCSFYGVNWANSKFRRCSVLGDVAMIERLVVSSESRLDVDGIVPLGNLLSIVDASNGEEIFDPMEVRAFLRSAGMPGMTDRPVVFDDYSQRGKDRIWLLGRLSVAYRRSNPVCVDRQDRRNRNIFRHSEWQELEDLLVDYQIVKLEPRDTSGASRRFLRRRIDFDRLMRMQADQELPADMLGDFWRAMRAV